MKKRTLNQTWILCLRMWRSIAKEWTPNGYSVTILKDIWLRKNGFRVEYLFANCFFCEFQKDVGGCQQCPGTLVDNSFGCENKAYDYRYKPVAFYKELLRLNRIRKAKK